MAGNGHGTGSQHGSLQNQQQGAFSGDGIPPFHNQAGGGFGFAGGYHGDDSGSFQQGRVWGNAPQGPGGGSFVGGQQWHAPAPGPGIHQQPMIFGVPQGVVQQGMGSGSSFQPQQNNFLGGSSSGHAQGFPQREFNPGHGGGRGGQRQRGRGRDRRRGRQSVGRGYGGRGTQYGFQAGEDAHFPQQQPTSLPGMDQNPSGRPLRSTETQRHSAGPSTTVVNNTSNTVLKTPEVPQGVETETQVQADGIEEGKLTGEKRKKKKGKGKQEDAWCFRCCSKGHVSAECTSKLFCNICESEEHVAVKCPLKKKPRPVALAVGYAVDDLGFYHIPHGPIPMSKMESNTVLIKVEGGSLTEEDLIGHLKRLVSSTFEWDVQIYAPNMWVAPFTSKTEFTRAINFGSADLKNGMRLNLEKYEEEDEYFGHELPMVWMRTVNLPKVLRTYEVLWAIGTMFGATQKVDMITTRKNKFGRFQVAVLNPTIVPTRMDCVIGTHFFELRFGIEPFNTNAELDISQREKHDDNEGDNNGSPQDDTEMEDASKKPKRVNETDKSMGKNKDSTSPGGMQQEESGFNPDEDDLLDQDTQKDGESSVSTAKNLGDNIVVDMKHGVISGEDFVHTTDAEDTPEHPSQALGPFLERALKGLKEAHGVLDGVSCDEAAEGFTTPAAALLMEDQTTPLRRSKRRAATVDEDSIERASRLVAKKNLEVDEGHLQRDTLDPVLDTTAKRGRATPNYFGVSCA